MSVGLLHTNEFGPDQTMVHILYVYTYICIIYVDSDRRLLIIVYNVFFSRISYFTGLLFNFVFTAALCSELKLVYVVFNIMYMDFYMLRVVFLVYILNTRSLYGYNLFKHFTRDGASVSSVAVFVITMTLV